MLPIQVLAAGHTEALQYACQFLTKKGFSVAHNPSKTITHLLLPVPSFENNGEVKGGKDLQTILETLPENITVIGGNLTHPLLENYKTIDLLRDQTYLALNGRITAYCALSLAMEHLSCTPDGQPVLVIGWGRIGKCLAQLLKALGADVTVAARKEADRAAVLSLGYNATDIPNISPDKYRVIFNTAPHLLLPDAGACSCKIDLASDRGIGGENVLWARGLPNKMAPESSGKLIAQRIIALLKEGKL